jgi:hypothetical protein
MLPTIKEFTGIKVLQMLEVIIDLHQVPCGPQ